VVIIRGSLKFEASGAKREAQGGFTKGMEGVIVAVLASLGGKGKAP